MKVKSDHRSEFSNLSNWKEEAWKNQGFNRDDCRQHGLKVAVICSEWNRLPSLWSRCCIYCPLVLWTWCRRYAFRWTYWSRNKQRRSFGKLKTVDEVIWDEASMSSASPVPELSFLPAAYRGWTRARERRVQDNLHAHAQNEPIKNY